MDAQAFYWMLGIAAAVIAAMVGLTLWIIRLWLGGVDKKLDKQGETLTEIKLGLRDCVKWGDLDRELDPLKNEVKQHGETLAAFQVRCAERHKG